MADFGSRNSGFFGGTSSGGGGVSSVGATTPLTSSGGATPNISIPQANSTIDGYLSSTDWTTFNNKPSNNQIVSGYQGLGSTIKASPIGINLLLNIATATSLVGGRQILTPIYLSTTSTITGVKWFQARLGNYTATNYNGVGLYSVSGSTLTLIASSTNDGTIWQTFATGTWGNKAFSSPLPSLSAGTYYVSALYNSSPEVLAPQLQTITSSPAIVQVFDFTGSRLNCTLASQNTLQSSFALSGTSGAIAMHWLSLY